MQKINLPLSLLRTVEKPARYVGGERNQILKEIPENDKKLLRFAFAFPDTYEIAMSNAALQIIYGLLNEDEDIWCERVFAPWPDMEEKLRNGNIPLFTLESRTPLSELDVIGFTLQYELSVTNVLNMLDLAGIPLYAKDRSRKDPLICAGGPVIYNPEPMADFFDFILIGDAEETLLPVMDEIKKYKDDESLSKDELFLRLASMPGIYVPSLYEVSYRADGTIETIAAVNDKVPSRIKKAVVTDLDRVYYPIQPIVPNTDIVHDRMFLEIFRGCPRGCRFCQAGIAYRPMREKSPELLTDQACAIAAATGYDELGTLSLSTSDYSCLPELTDALLDSFTEKRISLSLPSLRVDNFSMDLLDKVSNTRKSGLTFAPEAGTQRMRDVINKGVTEEELMTSMRLAFEGGYDRVKLYFMLGLPGETDEDVLGISDLARKILDLYAKVHAGKRKRRLDLTVSTSLFIPKPMTPFQWVGQVATEELLRRRDLLKEHMPDQVRYNYHEAKSSLWEAVLSRGDRRLAPMIHEVWKKGQTFDSWDEHFNDENWQAAAEKTNIDPAFYALRERRADELLPWSHIDCGVSERFLMREWEKAKRAELTLECRLDCQACGAQHYRSGICPTSKNSLSVKRSAFIPKRLSRNDNLTNESPDRHTNHATIEERFTMRLLFSRNGQAAMLAHLDVMRSFERSLRRADIPMQYSEGFNPRPLLVFALPLSVGLEAANDCVDIGMTEIRQPEEFLRKLNEVLPSGFRANEARLIEGKASSVMAQVRAAGYRFVFPQAGSFGGKLMAREELVVPKFTKGKLKPLDIRPRILRSVPVDEDTLEVLVKAGSTDNLRADLLLDAMVLHLGLNRETADNARMIRIKLYGYDQEEKLFEIR